MTNENFLEILKNIKTVEEAKSLKDDVIGSDNVLEFINYLRYVQYNDESVDFKTINKINKFLAFKELTTIENENEHLNFGDNPELFTEEVVEEDDTFKINVIEKSRNVFSNDTSKKLKLKAALKDSFETILIVKENDELSKYGFITKDNVNYIYALDNEHEDYLNEVVNVDVDTTVTLFALKTVKGNISKTFKKIDLEKINLEEDYFLTKKTNKGVLSLVSGGVIMTLASETVLTYNEDDYKTEEPESTENQGGLPDLSGMAKKLGLDPDKIKEKVQEMFGKGATVDENGIISGGNVVQGDDVLDLSENNEKDEDEVTEEILEEKFEEVFNKLNDKLGIDVSDVTGDENADEGVISNKNRNKLEKVLEQLNDEEELEEALLFESKEPTDIVIAGTCYSDGNSDFGITDDYAGFGLSVNKKEIKGFGYLESDGFVNVLTLTKFLEKVKNNEVGWNLSGPSEVFNNGSDFVLIKNYVGKVKLAVKVLETEEPEDENTWIPTTKLTDEYIDHDKYLERFGEDVYTDIYIDFDNDVKASKIDKKIYKKLKKTYLRGKKIDNINN